MFKCRLLFSVIAQEVLTHSKRFFLIEPSLYLVALYDRVESRFDGAAFSKKNPVFSLRCSVAACCSRGMVPVIWNSLLCHTFKRTEWRLAWGIAVFHPLPPMVTFHFYDTIIVFFLWSRRDIVLTLWSSLSNWLSLLQIHSGRGAPLMSETGIIKILL